MMRNETRLPILPVKPLGDKVTRAHACSPLVESGRVFLPDQAPWRRDFMDEVSFPAAPHNDQVDTMTQALNYLREHQYEPFRYQPLPQLPSSPWLETRRPAGATCQAPDDADDRRATARSLFNRVKCNCSVARAQTSGALDAFDNPVWILAEKTGRQRPRLEPAAIAREQQTAPNHVHGPDNDSRPRRIGPALRIVCELAPWRADGQRDL